MRCLKTTLLLSISLVLSAVTTSQAQVDFSQTYTFGDSLTDNDAEFLSNLFGVNPKLYGADPFEAVFNKGADEDDNLSNFAVLGSRSSDVMTQVQMYREARLAGAIPAATCFSLQAGANDILDLENFSADLFLLAAVPPGANEQADDIVADVKINLLLSVWTMWDTDPAVPTVIWTVPDVTITPFVMSLQFTPEQQQNIRLHIECINQFIGHVAQAAELAVFDSYQFLNDMAVHPPVVHDVTIESAPAMGFPTAQFADPIHPTAIANGLVANEIIAALNKSFNGAIDYYTDEELASMAGIR